MGTMTCLQGAGGVVSAVAGTYSGVEPSSQAAAGAGTSRALGHSAAQRAGVSPQPELQAFELTSQDSFLVRCAASHHLPAVHRLLPGMCHTSALGF